MKDLNKAERLLIWIGPICIIYPCDPLYTVAALWGPFKCTVDSSMGGYPLLTLCKIWVYGFAAVHLSPVMGDSDYHSGVHDHLFYIE